MIKNEVPTSEIENFFIESNQNPLDYGLNFDEIHQYYQQELTKFNAYSLIRSNTSKNKTLKFDYQKYLYIEHRTDKKKIDCYDYCLLTELNEGQYFGEWAIESKKNERTASVKALEPTYLGSISRVEYRNNIMIEKQKQAIKEVKFLHQNKIFHHLNFYYFQSKFFLYFVESLYEKGEYIGRTNEIKEYIYLVREGELEVSYEGSLNDLNRLINQIKNKLYGRDENNFSKSKIQSKESSQKRKMKIFILKDGHNIGYEEYAFFNSIRLFDIKVISGKSTLYKLSVENLNKIFSDEEECKRRFYEETYKKMDILLIRLKNLYKEFSENCDSKSQIFETIKNERIEKILNENKVNFKLILGKHEKSISQVVVDSKLSLKNQNNLKNEIKQNETNEMPIPLPNEVRKRIKTSKEISLPETSMMKNMNRKRISMFPLFKVEKKGNKMNRQEHYYNEKDFKLYQNFTVSPYRSIDIESVKRKQIQSYFSHSNFMKTFNISTKRNDKNEKSEMKTGMRNYSDILNIGVLKKTPLSKSRNKLSHLYEKMRKTVRKSEYDSKNKIIK